MKEKFLFILSILLIINCSKQNDLLYNVVLTDNLSELFYKENDWYDELKKSKTLYKIDDNISVYVYQIKPKKMFVKYQIIKVKSKNYIYFFPIMDNYYYILNSKKMFLNNFKKVKINELSIERHFNVILKDLNFYYSENNFKVNKENIKKILDVIFIECYGAKEANTKDYNKILNPFLSLVDSSDIKNFDYYINNKKDIALFENNLEKNVFYYFYFQTIFEIKLYIDDKNLIQTKIDLKNKEYLFYIF